MSDMYPRYRLGIDRSCQQRDIITNEHRYHFDIFNIVINLQLRELDDRFPKQTMVLIVLSSALDSRDGFRSFNKDDICNLAEKFYLQDFTPSKLHALKLQLAFYGNDIHHHHELQNILSLSDLYVWLVEIRLVYHLIHKLICLVLTLPISITTTE